MNPVPALAIIVVSALAAYFATRVQDEMQYLEKPLRVLQAVSGLALLAVLPWWSALIITGALALGWLPMAGAIGFLAARSSSLGTEPALVGLAALTLALALLSGARWTLDKRAPLVYAGAVVAFTLVFSGLGVLGAF